MKIINIGQKKPIKVGNSYYISIPIVFIHWGTIKTNKSYQVLLRPTQGQNNLNNFIILTHIQKNSFPALIHGIYTPI